ncbi:hypothetical protein JCM8547_004534 [Rhodosporidiobolus lusitaniae]
MSNPFADPQLSYNADSNPFADPAVQGGLQSHSTYLENDDAKHTVDLEAQASTPNHQERLRELERREQELAAREAALANKAEHIRKHGRNNWPPGPFPLLFHDISQEIPEAHQATVLTLYRIWMFLGITLVVNLVGAILLLVSGASNGGADLGAGIFYTPVILALNFLLVYRPAYNAYAKEYAFFYYLFFLFGAFHVAFCAYMFVGIPSSGSAGLINTITRFTGGHWVAAVFCTLATVGWALEGLAFLWMYKNVWAHSHGEQGHSLQQAKEEISALGLKAYLFKAHSMPPRAT